MVVVAFSLHVRIRGEGLMTHSLPALVFLLLFYFFKNWRSAGMHQLHPLGQDQSIVVQQAETTVDEYSPMSSV